MTAVVFDFNDCDLSVEDCDLVVNAADVLPELTHATMRAIEPVGAYFERAFADDLFASFFDGTGPKKAATTGAGAAAAASKGPERSKGTGKRAIVLSETELEEDWYGVLGIGDNGDSLSAEEIRLAYRQRCLETHPDKHGGSDVEFKKVQRAFEILNDPDARRSIDSSRPFDDSVPAPSDVKSDADFYKLYGSTFSRNGRWSTVQPVATLGDDTQSAAEARKFYDFWLSFSSWRDFSHEVELETVSDDMVRYEKRFVARENERLLEKLRRQESKRIRTLVEDAMRLDPRLRRQREAEQKIRDEAAAKKAAEIRRREEEEARRQAEEIQRQEEAKAKAKAEVERKKSLLRDAFKSLADFLQSKGLIDSVETNMLLPDKVRKPNVQFLMQKTDSEAAAALVEKIIKAENPVTAFNDAVTTTEQAIGMTRYGEPISAGKSSAPAAAAPAPVAAVAVWSADDISNLRKAIAKFPPGTMERWRRIATTLRDKFTEEQVLAKTKELEHFSSGNASTATAAAPGAATAAHVDPATGTPAKTAAPVQTTPTGIPVTGAEPDGGDWTMKQQKQLETALRDLRDYKEKDKFIKVAAQVEGKTAAQCFERYKYIANLMKKK